MKIRCIHCGEYFFPDEETLELMTEGHISTSDVNTCDECWQILNQPPDDLSEMYSDADPGL
jgi:hypothetical protein